MEPATGPSKPGAAKTPELGSATPPALTRSSSSIAVTDTTRTRRFSLEAYFWLSR